MNLTPSIFLTGLTGGLGSQMISHLVRAYPNEQIVALVRGQDANDVQKRWGEAATFSQLTQEERNRVVPLRGDVTQPNFGLEPASWKRLAMSVSQIFHMAANVDFQATLAQTRHANVAGTAEILRFARECLEHQGPKDFRLNHVSTAYVAGDRRGQLKESELSCGQKFWNPYEQSKYEAELLVREASPDIPSTIYRPSLVIGESTTGRIRKYFGFYEFVRLAARGQGGVTLDFGGLELRQDMVPSDYVCEALLYFSRRVDAIGRTYHLASGLENSLPFDRLVQIIYEVLQETYPGRKTFARPRFIHPDHKSEGESISLNSSTTNFDTSALKILLRTYMPYMSYERDFDIQETRTQLAAAGIVMAPIEGIIRATTRYAVTHDRRGPRYGLQWQGMLAK